MRTALAVLRKDLLLELRTLETVPAMILFAVVTFVIFHFGLNRETIAGQLAAGLDEVTHVDELRKGFRRQERADLEVTDARCVFLADPALLGGSGRKRPTRVEPPFQ